jgi:hypothetical protein
MQPQKEACVKLKEKQIVLRTVLIVMITMTEHLIAHAKKDLEIRMYHTNTATV